VVSVSLLPSSYSWSSSSLPFLCSVKIVVNIVVIILFDVHVHVVAVDGITVVAADHHHTIIIMICIVLFQDTILNSIDAFQGFVFFLLPLTVDIAVVDIVVANSIVIVRKKSFARFVSHGW